MTTKRAIRPQWLIFILLAVGLTAFLMFFSDSGGYTRVDTSAALDLIATDKVDTARVVNNERIELALKDGVTYSDGARQGRDEGLRLLRRRPWSADRQGTR